MNFDWTPEEQEIKEKVAKLFDQDARDDLESMEAADLPGLREMTIDYLGRLAGTGYLQLGIGPDGREQTTALIAAQEALAGISGSLFLAVEASTRLFGGLVAGWGKDGTSSDILAPLQRGEMIGAVALSEVEDPTSPVQFTTSAWKDGNDYIVSGKKNFVSNGPIADCFAVVGELDGKLAIFLVDADQQGVKKGARLSTVGYNGLAVCSLELDQVRVAETRVIGPLEDRSPLEFLNQSNDLILSVASVGLIQRTVAVSMVHSQSHQRGGKPVFHYQEIRFKFAEMLTLSHAAQLLAYRAGWFLATADPEAVTVLNCAKVFTAEASEQVAGMAMQIMAGKGYVSGNIVERGYREAKYAAIAGTTSENARMAVADDLLRKYKV